MKHITSSENKLYKETKKLLQHTHRAKAGLFIAEGERLVADALQGGGVRYVFVSESYGGTQGGFEPAYCLPDRLFAGISDTKTTQGIAAVCEIRTVDVQDVPQGLLVVCDGVADPGNLGAIIRTAECAGAVAVLLLDGCADPYNPKTVRATMGSIFRIPVCRTGTTTLGSLKGYDIAAAVLDGSRNLYDITFGKNTAVIIGSEAHGVSDEAAAYAGIRLKIPMSGGAESLNASVAAGVILYEIHRQICFGERSIL